MSSMKDGVADEIRAVADLVERVQKSGVYLPLPSYTIGHGLSFYFWTWDVPDYYDAESDEERGELVLEVLRAAVKAFGGTWSKNDPSSSRTDDAEYKLTNESLIPGVQITLTVDRDSVCERVQVGTKTVVRPAIEARDEETVEEPVYERQCRPLFSRGQVETLDSVVAS